MRHRCAVDAARLRAAIVEAEESTDASIRVAVAPYFWGDVRRTAHRALAAHAAPEAARRNAVLFFVVPARREFAILGEADAHERLGQETWNAVAAGIQDDARSGDLTSALVRGIEEVGRRLAMHFPRRDSGLEHGSSSSNRGRLAGHGNVVSPTDRTTNHESHT